MDETIYNSLKTAYLRASEIGETEIAKSIYQIVYDNIDWWERDDDEYNNIMNFNSNFQTINFQSNMERNRYQFFMCNKRTTEKELIYEGWHTKGDMVTMTAGILVGLHRFRPAAYVWVYLCKEDGTTELVHECR